MPVSGIKLGNKSLNARIANLQLLKQIAERATEAYEEAQADFIKAMEAEGRKTLRDGTLKVTLVTRDIPKYDEKGLAKSLGATLWNKITKKTLDKAKLEKAVDEGEIDINVVAQHTTVTPAKPHLRFSAVLPDEERVAFRLACCCTSGTTRSTWGVDGRGTHGGKGPGTTESCGPVGPWARTEDGSEVLHGI